MNKVFKKISLFINFLFWCIIKKAILLSLGLTIVTQSAFAVIIYSSDFTTAGQGFTHNNDSPPSDTPQSVNGGMSTNPEGRWTASYTTKPATDGTKNEFITANGKMRIQDWGGEARWQSFPIDVSAISSVDIKAVGVTIGEDVQNVNSEFFQYFYNLDGETDQTTAVTVSNESAGTDINYSLTNLDVSTIDKLIVGFKFNVNNVDDGYEIHSFTVEGRFIPMNQPTSFTATANSTSQITTSWTDSTGANLPSGYFVLCSKTNSLATNSTVQDDTNCADGSGIKNIAQGVETYVWTGLDANTQYYFKIYPYSDSLIDYKTDATPATAKATTHSNMKDLSNVDNNTDNHYFGTPPPQPDYYQLSVAGTQAHIKSNPSGIDCKFGEGICSKLFARGEKVKLKLINVKTADEFHQDDYNIVWEGNNAGCEKQAVRMYDTINCLVRVYGKQGIDYSANQLKFINFSGINMLAGGAENLILGFILEGDSEAMIKAEIVDTGVLPQLDINQLIFNENVGWYAHLLKQQQQNEDFFLHQKIAAGAYTIQMSSHGSKGRGMASVSLIKNELSLSNISVRGQLQGALILNFVVTGQGTQQIKVSSQLLDGQVTTELRVLDLLNQQNLPMTSVEDGIIVEVTAGAYAAILDILSGQGIGMINVNLLQ
jgi:hypothetical protein